MKTRLFSVGISLALMVLGVPLAVLVTAQVAKLKPQQKTKTPVATAAHKTSGPYQYENLTIFLIHGKDAISGRKILTLQEAMQQKKIIVYETQDVNELTIENVSRDEEVFVQSGDIVKGGQQDRLLAVDLIVPARSGKIPIAAFCVESGRWSKRGAEQVTQFEASSDRIATKDLKIAANITRSQQEVWERVDEAQTKLSTNVGARVNAPASESSLQLSLENKRVQETTDNYIKRLSGIVESQPDAIGYAFAINGKMNSAEVYASSALFKKLWPKLLKATAVEAVAELRKGEKFEAVTEDDVQAFLADADKGKQSEKEVTKRIQMVTRETEQNIVFETRDRMKAEAWIHRSYVKK